MKEPLVSVIVPTKNSESFLGACLQSIKSQNYKNIELIVVDNFSTDKTPEIAKKFGAKFFAKGPERSAQRNFGVSKSKGSYVATIDSDMELAKTVISECVSAMQPEKVAGIIIPEESFGEGFWARCKRLERSFYVGVDWMEAARFFRKSDYERQGGYNVALVSGEDWDLSNRMRKIGSIARIQSYIRHNEGHISLYKTLKKKSYYASKISEYVDANAESTSTGSEILKVFKRFGLYFSKPTKLFQNPILGLGMLFMKVAEFGFGVVGWALSKR